MYSREEQETYRDIATCEKRGGLTTRSSLLGCRFIDECGGGERGSSSRPVARGTTKKRTQRRHDNNDYKKRGALLKRTLEKKRSRLFRSGAAARYTRKGRPATEKRTISQPLVGSWGNRGIGFREGIRYAGGFSISVLYVGLKKFFSLELKKRLPQAPPKRHPLFTRLLSKRF